MTEVRGRMVTTIANQWVNLGPLTILARPTRVWNTASAPMVKPHHAISIT
jgi:hypothetical protein